MKTLIITDVQHDFMPGGALGVPHANEIIPIINALIPHFEHVIATLDWHPENHVSFASTHGKKPGEMFGTQILWPDHCVQNSHGANLVAGLKKEKIEAIFHKGTDPDVDSYSAFFDDARHRATGLDEYLEKHKLRDLYFVGLATDYCVLYSVLDALELGFSVSVIRDACRAINLHPLDEQRALETMRAGGAKFVFSKDFLGKEKSRSPIL